MNGKLEMYSLLLNWNNKILYLLRRKIIQLLFSTTKIMDYLKNFGIRAPVSF